MKKWLCLAMFACLLAACYTPLNNSGVATTKPWLEIPAKKTDFDGKQYDSCYRFNVRFWPMEAAEKIDLQAACISACCWRSNTEKVTLDFNKNFENDLAIYGRARKYTPGKITLQVHHVNWLNTTRVSVSPKTAINNDGLIKLSYKEYENPARLAQLDEQARHAATSFRHAPSNQSTKTISKPVVSRKTAAKAAMTHTIHTVNPAKAIVQRKAGPKIDSFFYNMNKQYNKQGAVFLISERVLYTQETGEENIFIVSCLAKARTGLDSSQLRASTFPCGQWRVNTQTEELVPYDQRAKLIWEP